MATVPLPTTTQYVDQKWFLEPLSGDKHPTSYLEHFPEEVYNTGPDSHLTRFMYALLGPSGVGFLRQNALEARLRLEEMGLELFDLEAFYGQPLSFTRITEEVYEDDPRGLVDRKAWDTIRAKDAQYRARVLDFLDGVRAGNTPFGMKLVAKSGLGHDVSIIENYRALFDEYSDDPLGLVNYGRTRFTEEMIVLPRREVPLSEVQIVSITGSPAGGTFLLYLNGEPTSAIAWNATADNMRTFLEALPSILPGDIETSGGPLPNLPIRVRFMGTWAARNVPEMTADGALLTGGTAPTVHIETVQGGVDAADEVAYISDSDKHHLQEALDRLRPVIVIPTMGSSPGLRARQLWGSLQATSEYDEMVRYVTGNAQIPWPGRDSLHWIEKGVEREAPKAIKDRQYQYMAYHNVQAVSAFTDAAVLDPSYGTTSTPSVVESNSSAHVGPFSEFQTVVFPFLANEQTFQYYPVMVLADQPEPLTIRNIIEDEQTNATVTQLINGMYPQDYADLPGVPQVTYDYEQFWASRERVEGIDYIEIDLGVVRGINHLQFESTNKPINITIEFDLLDLNPRRLYTPVNLDPVRSAPLVKTFVPENLNPWTYNEFSFNNDNNELIFTRFIRIGFERVNNTSSPFLVSGTDMDPQYHPWSIDVRNLRVGRNVTNM